MNPDELSERLLTFAARVGKLVDALPDTRLGRHVAGQLLRCGTSPADESTQLYRIMGQSIVTAKEEK